MSEDLNDGATAEVQESVEVEQTLDDTLLETLSSIKERDEEVVEPEVKLDKVRDEKGKFAKQEEKEVVAPEANAEVNTEVPEANAETAQPLPNTWKKEAAEAWAKADPVLKAEVARREADIHKGIEQYKQAADFAYSVDTVVAPYKQTIDRLGMTPQDAIKAMLDVDHKLRYSSPQDKVIHLAQLARTYGIDLNEAVTASNNVDPRLYDLAHQNELLKNQFEQQKQQAEMQAQQELNSQIATFASDPKHTHFETVKLHMAALLQASQAKDLEDAYEQAIYANPVTRAAVLQQQVQAAKEEAARKAQTARAASGVNLRSSPAMPSVQPVGTIEDTLRDAYRTLRN